MNTKHRSVMDLVIVLVLVAIVCLFAGIGFAPFAGFVGLILLAAAGLIAYGRIKDWW